MVIIPARRGEEPDMQANRIGRRALIFGAACSAVALAVPGLAAGRNFPLQRSEAEWRRILTPRQFRILRLRGTEPPFSSPLLGERRRGWFVCAADGSRLFASSTKYDSRTGWPSFYRPVARATGTSADHDLGYRRTEVRCARCGGHLGHVFNDGPAPTGLRYCINGDALRFVPA